MHLGLDTVELKGAPFTINVKPGDEVKAGSVIGTMDLDAIKKSWQRSSSFDDYC